MLMQNPIMRVYKKNVVPLRNNNSTGDLTRAVANYSRCLVAEQKLNISAKSNIRVVQKPLYPEAASNPFEIKKWGRTKKAIETKNVKKKKYTVYAGKQLFKIGAKIISKETK